MHPNQNQMLSSVVSMAVRFTMASRWKATINRWMDKQRCDTHTGGVYFPVTARERHTLQCGQTSGTLLSDGKQTLRIDSSGVEYPEGRKDSMQNGGDQRGPDGGMGTTAQKASNISLRGEL